jgi:hypothetical protein
LRKTSLGKKWMGAPPKPEQAKRAKEKMLTWVIADFQSHMAADTPIKHDCGQLLSDGICKHTCRRD